MSALELELELESAEMPAIALADADPPAVDVHAISLAMSCGRWEEALSLLRPAITSPHTPADVRLDYARCLIETRRVEKALRILAICGERTFEHFILVARAAALQGDDDTAVYSIQDAFVLDADGTRATVMRLPELRRFFGSIRVSGT